MKINFFALFMKTQHLQVLGTATMMASLREDRRSRRKGIGSLRGGRIRLRFHRSGTGFSLRFECLATMKFVEIPLKERPELVQTTRIVPELAFMRLNVPRKRSKEKQVVHIHVW